jgi:hypothetical protein
MIRGLWRSGLCDEVGGALLAAGALRVPNIDLRVPGVLRVPFPTPPLCHTSRVWPQGWIWYPQYPQLYLLFKIMIKNTENTGLKSIKSGQKAMTNER